MQLFEEWFCEEFLCLQLATEDRELIAATLRFLEDAALGQASVAVHRDYHSRNLMLLDSAVFGKAAGPGVIDFQDAVSGAYTYDLVSLLRDCYIQWSPQQVREWALYYLDQAQISAAIPATTTEQFLRDFDLMGLQRNLKVMGIFARLCIRDKKSQYLADIPLVIQYFLNVSQHYPELAHFRDWFSNAVLPIAISKLPWNK
jgi:aminoglycoside/choline kinase family phosphotransferase